MTDRGPFPLYAVAGMLAGLAFIITGIFTENGTRVVAIAVGAIFAFMGVVLPRLRSGGGSGRDRDRNRRRNRVR